MIFAVTTLISALSISCIAAYFSIIGLATIFPGSIYAVVCMGVALEIGKIIAALWLHKNWGNAPRSIKGYLLFAIFVLMGITSMGIFGFLSKSHIEHEQQAQKSQAMISQVDSKILREQDYIARQKELIEQEKQAQESQGDKSSDNIEIEKQKIAQINAELDKNLAIDNKIISDARLRISELDSILNEEKSKSGGLFSSKKEKIKEIEQSQVQERTSLESKINSAEERISKSRDQNQLLIQDIRKKIESYQEDSYKSSSSVERIEGLNKNITDALNRIEQFEVEKFDYNDGSMQLEAEIGPVKYVAELISDIFGVAFDLGQAVRIVIIILIFVFDPLAILLVLAAHISLVKYFPSMKIEESDIIQKQSSIAIETKIIEEQELQLEERKKDLDQELELIEIRENQIKKYNQQISESKEAARKLKIEAEKSKLEKEDHSDLDLEIEMLNSQKEQLSKEISDLQHCHSEIERKESESNQHLEEMKKIFKEYKAIKNEGSNNILELSKTREEIKSKLKEINDLKDFLSARSPLVEEFEKLKSSNEKNSEYIKELEEKNENLKLLAEKNTNSYTIKKQMPDGKFAVLVKSNLGGTHQFIKENDFSESEILNCQAISCEIDEICPQRQGPLLQKVFNTNIKKYLNERLDNRAYKKSRPEYNFIS